MSKFLGSALVCLIAASLLTACTQPAPLRVAMFFDNSMSTQEIHTYLKDAVSIIYKELGAEDTVKVYRLGKTLYPLNDEKAPQNAGIGALLSALDRPQPEEYGTSLGAALDQASGFIHTAGGASRRTVLVIFSDVADEQSTGTFNATIPQLEAWGKRVARAGANVVFIGPEGVLRNRIDVTLRPILGAQLGICSNNEPSTCYRDLIANFRN